MSDYVFSSNALLESVKYGDILASLSYDHSPLLIALKDDKTRLRGKDLRKFNSLLL